MFSIGLDSGVIRLAEYNPVTDSNFIEVNVTAFDNLGNDPSLTSSEIVKVRFCTDITYTYNDSLTKDLQQIQIAPSVIY